MISALIHNIGAFVIVVCAGVLRSKRIVIATGASLALGVAVYPDPEAFICLSLAGILGVAALISVWSESQDFVQFCASRGQNPFRPLRKEKK